MKRFILIILLLSGLNSFTQVADSEKKLKKLRADSADGWEKGGLVNLNFTQVSLTNWAAGGQNSISTAGFSSLFSNYKKGKSTWDNSLVLQFGQVKQGGKGFIKSDDRLQFTSKFGRDAGKFWYYAALLDFQTQFTVGYAEPNNSATKISDFMAPAYFVGALGMDFKPTNNFALFIAPITAKYTVVGDDSLAFRGAYGVQAHEVDGNSGITNFENTRLEIGGYLRLMFKKKIMENISYQTNLGLFSNYANKPQNMDINWDNLLNMKVNKYISASITTSLIYDDDVNITISKDDGSTPKVGPRTQFKYVLGVGLAFTLGDK
ncbi:DUF3078 domain-containing protein [Vicingaceae bacterium]|nr:DUF3078 domain-containing protein [Vicingaceae bacterium]MDB4061416.1 DUF3078 domain-containing protein [Vicingaceae bacterium]MDC1451457.1 DUF3078 domain-containing protein [Vicingaceae bacterium]